VLSASKKKIFAVAKKITTSRLLLGAAALKTP
jgi:hypothetical protein